MNRRLVTRVGIVALVQLALVAVAVAPQLSARVTGDEYRLRVAAFDPIDPFRGAYVDLDYPDLREPGGSFPASMNDGESGIVYATLVQDGEIWVLGEYTRTRPDQGPYLACDDRDWRIRCGIESWFASQEDAARLGRELARDGAVATLRIDSRGNAALVAVDPR